MSDTHEVSWGKVLAGATIAAGAALVCVALFAPGMIGLGAAAATAGTAHIGAVAAMGAPTGVGAFFSGIGSFIASQVSALGTWVATNQVATATIAAVATGIGIDMADRKHERAEAKFERQIVAQDDQSFAMREDMRKMQALMLARMQAVGYQPAQAMGQQR